jgi:hypothetical protein
LKTGELTDSPVPRKVQDQCPALIF